jgi:D-cysteine desulfhydrase
MLGKALFYLDNWRIVGVPVSDSLDYFQREVRELVDQTIQKFDLDAVASKIPLDLLDGFIGDGYAIPYPQAIETIELLAQSEGIILDPTYTSKAMTGMLSAVRNGGVRSGAIPVFVHTGGAFGLFARRDLFQS